MLTYYSNWALVLWILSSLTTPDNTYIMTPGESFIIWYGSIKFVYAYWCLKLYKSNLSDYYKCNIHLKKPILFALVQ